MQESRDLKVGGLVTFWRCASYTWLADLKAGLENLALARFCPGARAPEAALRGALEEVFPNRTHRVEKLKNKKAFEVIEIERGEDRNRYLHSYWCGIDEHLQVEVRPFEYDTAKLVVETFNKHMGLVTAHAVTETLLGIIGHLSGTHLPGQGNLYWLPDSRLQEWKAIAQTIEGARTNRGRTGVYVIHHQMGPDEVRAVRDAIVEEISGEANRLHEEIMAGELGDRALENRKLLAEQLRDKVLLYEGLLSVGLGSLKSGLDKVEEAACAATLLTGNTLVSA